MALKSIEEHNSKRRAEIGDMYDNHPKPSGIACPKCGTEMMVDMLSLYMSSPPQRMVFCRECRHQQHVLA